MAVGSRINKYCSLISKKSSAVWLGSSGLLFTGASDLRFVSLTSVSPHHSLNDLMTIQDADSSDEEDDDDGDNTADVAELSEGEEDE